MQIMQQKNCDMHARIKIAGSEICETVHDTMFDVASGFDDLAVLLKAIRESLFGSYRTQINNL